MKYDYRENCVVNNFAYGACDFCKHISDCYGEELTDDFILKDGGTPPPEAEDASCLPR
jgi:hypothetical protein